MVSEWTVDTLREYTDQRLGDQQKAVDAALVAAKEAVAAALAAAEKAVLKAEGAADRRFESVNEFRGALADQATKFPQRIEVEQRFASQDEKLGLLDSRLTKVESYAAGQGGSWTKLTQVVSLVVALLAIYFALSK